jgi:hypothetical protein
MKLLLMTIALCAGMNAQYWGRSADPRVQTGLKPAASFEGLFKSINKGKLYVEVDGNVMEFRLSKKVPVKKGDQDLKPESLQPGQVVTVDAKYTIDGSLEAVKIALGKTEKRDPRVEQ